MRVLFHVQHLLGIGHQQRAAALARALMRSGAHVTVLNGGAPSHRVDFGGAAVVQLPWIRATDVSFKRLVDESGTEVDEALRERRRALVLDAVAAFAPDAVVIEGYPFARRAFRHELDPLIGAAKAHGSAVVSSIRDVLVEKPDAERRRATAERVIADFDLVLVHGDPSIIRLEDSFPEAALFGEKLRYTGYVREHRETGPTAAGKGEVIVSAGGGAVGRRLLETALAGRSLSAARDLAWRLLAGPNLPEEDFAALRRDLPSRVVVERFRADLPAMLRHCALSVSQGGYNTVVELLAAGARSVIVPFAAPGETEQTRRADRLAAEGLAHVLAEAELTPERLAAAIDQALAARPPQGRAIDLGGAEEAARAVAAVVGGRSRDAVGP